MKSGSASVGSAGGAFPSPSVPPPSSVVVVVSVAVVSVDDVDSVELVSVDELESGVVVVIVVTTVLPPVVTVVVIVVVAWAPKRRSCRNCGRRRSEGDQHTESGAPDRVSPHFPSHTTSLTQAGRALLQALGALCRKAYADSSMPELPTGTLTLLFSDIEGSTKLLDDLGTEQYAITLKRHRSLMRRAFADNGEPRWIRRATHSSASSAGRPTLCRRPPTSNAPMQRRSGPPARSCECASGCTPVMPFGRERVTSVRRPPRSTSHERRSRRTGPLSQPTADLVQDELPEGLAVRDLGEHRLKDLSQPQHLYQLLADGLPSTFPPLKTLENRPTNLPQQPNRLIGREEELEHIVDRLRGRDTRLLTLVGPGGTGKTRLALQACAEVVDDFADGVFFVSLAPLRDATLVHASIAATLGVREQGGQTLDEALADYLSRKDLLLLLDNFEQVVEAAPQLAPLLASSNVSLLVTSREPLRLAAERVHSVPPLSTPERNGPIAAADALSHSAVRLFVERARAVRAEFELTDEVASDVAAICSQLDGMPLAVELAAARTNVLSPSALLQRLGKTLDTLSSGGRDVDERQRTLRAAIAWSYDLLPPEEQTLFEQLCVFVGGCRLEAAEEVCVGGVDVLTGLSSLAEKSLLRIRDDDDGERRFWMFETIREYALERLDARGEAAESRRRHLRYCADLATRAGAELAGPGAGRGSKSSNGRSTTSGSRSPTLRT